MTVERFIKELEKLDPKADIIIEPIVGEDEVVNGDERVSEEYKGYVYIGFYY